ncbi:MAG: RAD55 family ATPase [Candidatus Micrarchaeota archaeon]
MATTKNSPPPSNLQKIPTNIPGLDALFGGGLSPKSNILLYGEPMCGKKLLLMQFIYEGLRSNTPGIFTLTDFGYNEWKNKMQNLGWDLAPFEKNNTISIIDAYSRQFEPSIQSSEILHYVDSPSALSQISLTLTRITESIKSDTHRFSLHSLSSLLEETDEKSFYKFLQFIVGKFRKNNATAFYTMEKGMHDEKKVSMVEHLMNGVIEFEGGKIRVKGLAFANKDWHDYSVTQNGLQIKI